jgi:hypothetical protein
MTFGLFYWGAWYHSLFVARYVGLDAWQLGAILTGLFVLAASWSAWRRVDPLADLARLSDQDLMLTMISGAAGGLGYFSPRHALAGFAVVLIGGPASMFEAVGIWAHRLPADPGLIESAARLLVSCQTEVQPLTLHNVSGASLLHRLALVKIVPCDQTKGVMPTQKGRDMRPAASKPKARRRSKGSQEPS